MSHEHNHDHHGHHNHQTHPKQPRRIHHDWRFWAVILMLVGMAVYVMTNDEELEPGGAVGPAVPAAE